MLGNDVSDSGIGVNIGVEAQMRGKINFIIRLKRANYLMFASVLVCAILSGCNMKADEPRYISSNIAENYPSGSTISYLAGRFYVMGDDAAEILILNSAIREERRIRIFAKGDSARLPKTTKADIEASTVIRRNGRALILFLGSGSVSPHRDSAFLLDPATKRVKRVGMRPFYGQLRTNFNDLNIEGACIVGDLLLLGIRANSTYTKNHLVLANPREDLFEYKRKIELQLPVSNAGISGLDYDESKDMLLLTLSTEETPNSFDDGQIGNSYLAFISGVSHLLEQDVIMVKNIVNLNGIHPEFFGQKIESVSLTSNPGELLLVGDDDQGNTTFFTVGLNQETVSYPVRE